MSDNVEMPELNPNVDWTVNPITGLPDSSEYFLWLTEKVERLIRSLSHALINGQVDSAARTILAQLAYVYRLAPVRDIELEQTEATDWTVDPLTNLTNTSAVFLEIMSVIEKMILSSARQLLEGKAKEVAHDILVVLAHAYRLTPMNGEFYETGSRGSTV